MRIKHIFLQNFCKFYGSNVVDTDLYDRTEVSGVNETGKSTIKRAIQYIFGCRDENGREITGIRPSTICDMCNNNCAFLKLENIDKICSKLDCKLENFIEIVPSAERTDNESIKFI